MDHTENKLSNSFVVACIRCPGNIFTEPLHSNYGGTHTDTDWWEGLMDYVAEIGSGAMTYTSNYIKISSGI